MNVKQLTDFLSDYPDYYEVYISSDSEGNSIREIHLPEEAYLSLDGYDTSVVHPDDIPEYYDPSDVQKSVVIWPRW